MLCTRKLDDGDKRPLLFDLFRALAAKLAEVQASFSHLTPESMQQQLPFHQALTRCVSMFGCANMNSVIVPNPGRQRPTDEGDRQARAVIVDFLTLMLRHPRRVLRGTPRPAPPAAQGMRRSIAADVVTRPATPASRPAAACSHPR